MSLQSRSGGGDGMQTVGYDGSQSSPAKGGATGWIGAAVVSTGTSFARAPGHGAIVRSGHSSVITLRIRPRSDWSIVRPQRSLMAIQSLRYTQTFTTIGGSLKGWRRVWSGGVGCAGSDGRVLLHAGCATGAASYTTLRDSRSLLLLGCHPCGGADCRTRLPWRGCQLALDCARSTGAHRDDPGFGITGVRLAAYDRPVRVLFTSRPADGHYYPMVPLIEALVGAGDDVAVATAEPLLRFVGEAGIRTFRAGLTGDDPIVFAITTL